MKKKISTIGIAFIAVLLLVCIYVILFTVQIQNNSRAPFSWWRMHEYPRVPVSAMNPGAYLIMSNEPVLLPTNK